MSTLQRKIQSNLSFRYKEIAEISMDITQFRILCVIPPKSIYPAWKPGRPQQRKAAEKPDQS